MSDILLEPAPGLLCQYPGCDHAATHKFSVSFGGTVPQDIEYLGCPVHVTLWNTSVEPYGTVTPLMSGRIRCVYCGSEVPTDHPACCQEIGHVEPIPVGELPDYEPDARD